MKLLEKQNWWIWLLLAFMSGGSSIFALGALLGVYDWNAWYARWIKKWPKFLVGVMFGILGLVALVSATLLPIFMTFDIETLPTALEIILIIASLIYAILALAMAIFQIQILALVNAKLKTPGSEIYLSPYIWILCLIIPIIGWIMFIVMFLYLQIWYLVMLYRGRA